MSYSLSAAQAGALATRGRILRRQRAITAHQAALLDVMLWMARKPGSAVLTASLGVLARLSGQARSTIALGIARLEELGLIQRTRRRVRVSWLGGIASRQIANAYRLIAPDTESDRRSAKEQTSNISYVSAVPTGDRLAAIQSLDEVKRIRQNALNDRWLARSQDAAFR